MKKCERCLNDKEIFPFEDNICEDCCNELLLGQTPVPHDWSHIDFEKGDMK